MQSPRVRLIVWWPKWLDPGQAAHCVALIALVIVLAIGSTSAGQSSNAKAKTKADKTTQPPRIRLWVAAYYYPNGPGLHKWDRLIAAAKLVPIVAIVNPASGPGNHVDPYIAAVITRLARPAS